MEPEQTTTTADQLKSACAVGRTTFPADCSGAAKSIASQLAYTLPDLTANQLVDYFNESKNGWTIVDETRAQTLADAGKLVIAGKKGSPNGHVVVVYPGAKKKSGGYTYIDKKSGKQMTAADHGLYPRACSSSLGGWPGGVSDGDKTVFDSWGSGVNYVGVRYWSAPPPAAIAQKKTPIIQKLALGQEVTTCSHIQKGHLWEHQTACRASDDIHSGTVFLVRQVHTLEKWVELVTGSVLPVILRVSAEELDRLFKLRK